MRCGWVAPKSGGYAFGDKETVNAQPPTGSGGIGNLPNRSVRDINDGPIYAPDGSYASGDPDCYGCWPEGHPNTVAYSAGAVCCPTEASARRHERAGWRATWVDAGGPIDLGTPRFVWHELAGTYVAQYRFLTGLQRRWTR